MTRSRTLDFERPIVEIERKIDELRGFERDYRSRLHEYISGQLEDLKNVAGDGPDADAEQAAEPQPEHQG